MKVIRCKNYEEVSLEASKIMIELIKEKENATLGLATGSSPIGLYKKLIEAVKDKEISFKQIVTYNLDEYIGLDKNNEQSYFTFMNENLFKHIDIDLNNVHLPNGESKDTQKSCDEYNALLHNAEIDIQLLGIGANGHIGFNEPGTSFDQETFVVKLTEKTREDNKRFFASIDDVPRYAITMGIKNIMAAKKILLIATGLNKATAIKQIVSGRQTIDCPATALQNHDDVIVIIDEDAATLL